MKAMILAAGLGTRLRPLTDNRPKALVELNGRTLLEITLTRLRQFGVREAIVNVHHFADLITQYLKAHDNFGLSLAVSREEDLLDTGGGLKKAAHFFLEGASSEQPFIVHNVDVLTSIDLLRMVAFHNEKQALVTLAVQDRATSRRLLFDQRSELCGRQSGSESPEGVRQAEKTEALAFAGIHVVSPRLFSLMIEDGAFPILAAYLRLAAQGEKILAFRADGYYWRDLGRREQIEQAADDLRRGLVR
jgi:NDP-sugar pyrophosphorylase family protein